MRNNNLCVAAALFGLAHASVVFAEGAQQLAVEQSARPLSAFFGLDNNHFLCLDTTTPAIAVAFPAGHLVDPNGDLNADSKVMVFR